MRKYFPKLLPVPVMKIAYKALIRVQGKLLGKLRYQLALRQSMYLVDYPQGRLNVYFAQLISQA